MDEGRIRKIVRESYGRIARQEGSCCGANASCEGPAPAEEVGRRVGYSEEEMKSVPRGANLGLGCGNPTALASLKEGETVLDLGSGAGFDCFLASREVGPDGRVIGVDMTPEMIEKARENARRGGYANVEFRLGEIENLPAADASVDRIISNCVINLSTDKRRVFAEAFRVLKPGGSLMISDIVVSKRLPEELRNSAAAYVGCIAGAISKEEYLDLLGAAGFRDVRIVEETSSVDCFDTDPLARGALDKISVPPESVGEVGRAISSIKVRGEKPGRGCGA